VATFAGAEPVWLWHKDTDLRGVDAVIIPGGFSYGDYLRCGAIARFSPIMASIADFAAGGGLVMGICNGFQILTEAHLLPGALIRNIGLKFVCRYVDLRVENAGTPFTQAAEPGDVLRIVVKHNEGNYRVDPRTLSACAPKARSCCATARPTHRSGGAHRRHDRRLQPQTARSTTSAGVCNEEFNVFGMMPHPRTRSRPAWPAASTGVSSFRSIIDRVRDSAVAR